VCGRSIEKKEQQEGGRKEKERAKGKRKVTGKAGKQEDSCGALRVVSGVGSGVGGGVAGGGEAMRVDKVTFIWRIFGIV